MSGFPKSLRSRRTAVILSILIAVIIIVYMGASLVGYNVLSLPIAHHLTATPSDDYQSVSFPSRGQSYQVYGFYISGKPDSSSLIVVHGFRDDRRSENMLAKANALHDLGYTVLSIDLNANGGETTGTGRISMGYHERWDVVGAFDYLLTKGFTADRIGLVGESMGAATVMMAAALEPRIKAVWEESGYGRASVVVGENAAHNGFPPVIVPGGMIWAYLIAGDRLWEVNPVEIGPTLAANKQAVYIIHGDADATVPYHHGLELNDAFRAAGVDVTFWSLPGLGHVEGLAKVREEYLKRLDAFFKTHLTVKS